MWKFLLSVVMAAVLLGTTATSADARWVRRGYYRYPAYSYYYAPFGYYSYPGYYGSAYYPGYYAYPYVGYYVP